MSNFKTTLAGYPLFLLASVPGSLLFGASCAIGARAVFHATTTTLQYTGGIAAVLGFLMGATFYFMIASEYHFAAEGGKFRSNRKRRWSTADTWESDWLGASAVANLDTSSVVRFNPATGLPMLDGGGIDVGGNVFGSGDTLDSGTSAWDPTCDAGAIDLSSPLASLNFDSSPSFDID